MGKLSDKKLEPLRAGESMKKERGKLLTVMLVLSAIGTLATLPQAFDESVLEIRYETVPAWLPSYLLVQAAVSIGSIVGIWRLKKVGVYLLFAVMSVGVFANFLFLEPVYSDRFVKFVVFFATVCSFALWFWVIYRKWKYFG